VPSKSQRIVHSATGFPFKYANREIADSIAGC